MILTCPECATSYFVDDSRIRPGGRMVKCSNCGARWTAVMQPEAEADVDAEPAPVGSEPVAEPEPFVPAPHDDLEVVPIDPAALNAARAARTAPRKEAAGKVRVWIGAGIVVALIAGAILFRGQVVRLWPGAHGLYAALGLPVNALGLVIEGVAVKPAFQGGRPVLAVTGAIRSVRNAPVSAPPIRIDLLDRAGKPVAAKVLTPLDGSVPASATRHFAIVVADPPATVHDLEISFQADRPARGAPAVQARVPAPSPAGPAPVEAQPLPRGPLAPPHD